MTAALVVAAVALVGFVGRVVFVMKQVHTPTAGAEIDRGTRRRAALLVVDMQTDFVEGNGYDDADLASRVQHINARAAEARAAGVPIATLRQIYRGPVATTVIKLFGKGLGNPDSTGLELHHTLDVGADADFVKSRLDGFSNPALERWLATHQVGELEIVGLDGCHCVKATALGALDRGFEVRLTDAAILAVDRQRWQSHREKLVAAGAEVQTP